MSKLSPMGKMRRVLEFLLGLRDDRVLSALSACGFTDADRARGWKLLQELGMTQSAVVVLPKTSHETEIDEWRHQWMRIARVSLEHSHPSVYRQLFGGIDSHESSLLVVSAFMARFAKLERAADATSQSALAKLDRRGFTHERVDEARRLLATFAHPPSVTLPDLDRRRAEIASAERQFWAYYLEWSQIARAMIKDPQLLQLLGYREGQAADEDPPEPNAEVAPSRNTTRPKKRSKRRTLASAPTRTAARRAIEEK